MERGRRHPEVEMGPLLCETTERGSRILKISTFPFLDLDQRMERVTSPKSRGSLDMVFRHTNIFKQDTDTEGSQDMRVRLGVNEKSSSDF